MQKESASRGSTIVHRARDPVVAYRTGTDQVSWMPSSGGGVTQQITCSMSMRGLCMTEVAVLESAAAAQMPLVVLLT